MGLVPQYRKTSSCASHATGRERRRCRSGSSGPALQAVVGAERRPTDDHFGSANGPSTRMTSPLRTTRKCPLLRYLGDKNAHRVEQRLGHVSRRRADEPPRSRATCWIHAGPAVMMER